MRMRCMLVFCAVLLSSFAFAGDQPEAKNPLKPVAVAAFKNGLAFVIRTGTLPVNKGEGTISPIPDATLGTLWLAPNDPKVILDELIASKETSKAPDSVQSVEDFIRANVGRTVTITYGAKDYKGVLQAPPPPALQPDDDPNLIPRPGVFFLKSDTSTLAFNPSLINAIFVDGEVSTSLPHTISRYVLHVRVKGAGDAAPFTLGYLRKGLGWTPSYMISLEDEKTARLTMQAVVIDDTEDLDNTDLFFVVGFPNFQYSNLISPMTLQQTLAEFMNSTNRLNEVNTQYAMSNAIVAQRAAGIGPGYGGGTGASAADFSTTVGDLSGAPEEDLFLYQRRGVTLAKGQRASYNVFSATAPMEHIYRWDIAATQVTPYSSYSNQGFQEQQPDNVWHMLRLVNKSDFPWTSAPAIVLSGNKPVSQDTLLYTPKGGTTDLKLTVATDVRTDRQELETGRQPRAAHWNNLDYDVVQVSGTLKAKNHKATAIKLIVKKDLVGEVITVSDEGKAEKIAQPIRSENPNSRITWELTLAPGEEKTLTYTYKYLTR